MSTETRIVYCTFPDQETARKTARQLVSDRLVACANLVPQVESIYRWDETICTETEYLAIFKTASHRLEALQNTLANLHPYDCPEIIATEVVSGHAPYLRWIQEETE